MAGDLGNILGNMRLPEPFMPNAEALEKMSASVQDRQNELALMPAAAIIAVELVRRGVAGKPHKETLDGAAAQIAEVMWQVWELLKSQAAERDK